MADTLDLLTLAEGKEAVNFTSSSTNHDVKFAQFITAVSRRVDELCGPVVLVTHTNEAHNGGVRFLDLRHVPVSKTAASTVSAVTEYSGTSETTLTVETTTTQGATSFLFAPELGRLYRRSGGSDARFPVGRRNVLVTYSGGRHADTASVDAKFKNAAGSILRRLWQREGAAWAKGGDPFAEAGAGTVGFFKAVDPMVKELLHDELSPHALGLLVG